MGRVPCCDKANVKRGPWSPDEDAALRSYVEKHHGTVSNWIAMPQKAGLRRCGKSCRLRWLNYLRPDIKHGCFTEEEDNIICTLYNNIGSRWSVIASNLPGRTDNDVKNYWNTKLKKKLLLGIPNNSFPSSNPTSAQVLPPPAAPACTPSPRVLKTDQSAHTPHHLTAVPLDSGFGLISKEYSYPFAVSESSRGFVSPPSSVSTSVENWSASGTSYNSSTSTHDAFLWELLGIGSFGELLGEFAPIYSSSTTHGTNAQGFCHNVTNYS